MTAKTTARHARHGPGEPAAPRRYRRRLVVAAILAVLLLAVALTVIAAPSQNTSAELLAYPAGCPRSPMALVPDAAKYQVEVPCARIAGTVTAYRLNQAYDDLELTVVPERAYRSALPPANNGRFVVGITGPDLSAVTSPDLHTSGTFYGSWVEDRATHALMLMPAWRITTAPASGVNPDSLLFSSAAARHSGQAFSLSAGIPAALSPGVGLTIAVTAAWVARASGKHRPGGRMPASQIRILAEITGPSGDPLVWKAAQTGMLGGVTIRVPLIVTPGRYTCRLYAIAAGRVVSITRSFDVGRT